MNLNSKSEKRTELSFSNFFILWILVTITIIIGFNEIAKFVLLYSNALSSFEIVVEQILFLLWIPILSLAIFLSFFHVQPIDLSYNSIKQSLFQKLTFLLTSPILLIGYLILKIIIHSQFSNDSSFNVLFSFLFLIPLLFWIECTIKLRDLIQLDFVNKTWVKGEKTIENPYNQTLTKRWFTLSFGLPLILIAGSSFFNYFLAVTIILFSLNLFAVALSIVILNPIINKNRFVFLIRIYDQIFGKDDISEQITGIILLLIVLEIIVNAQFIFVNTKEIDIIFILLYLIVIVIFLIALFSNRINYFKKFKRTPKATDDDFLKSIERMRKGPFN